MAEASRLEASLSGAASPVKADAQPKTLEEEEARGTGGARAWWRDAEESCGPGSQVSGGGQLGAPWLSIRKAARGLSVDLPGLLPLTTWLWDFSPASSSCLP